MLMRASQNSLQLNFNLCDTPHGPAVTANASILPAAQRFCIYAIQDDSKSQQRVNIHPVSITSWQERRRPTQPQLLARLPGARCSSSAAIEGMRDCCVSQPASSTNSLHSIGLGGQKSWILYNHITVNKWKVAASGPVLPLFWEKNLKIRMCNTSRRSEN